MSIIIFNNSIHPVVQKDKRKGQLKGLEPNIFKDIFFFSIQIALCFSNTFINNLVSDRNAIINMQFLKLKIYLSYLCDSE